MAISADETHRTLRDKVKQLNDLMALVIIVLFIGFVSLLVAVWGLGVNYLDNGRGANEDLRDQVKTQNDSIQQLTDQVKSLTQALEKSTTQKTN